MRLIPDSTFARVIVVVAGVVAATFVAGGLLLGRFAMQQRVDFQADRLLASIQPVLQAEGSGPPSPDQLRRTAGSAGLALQAEPPPGPPPPRHLRRLIGRLHERLREALGPDLQLRVELGHQPQVWIQNQHTHDFWLGLPIRLAEPRPPVRALTWLALAALAAFLGAWLLTRSLIRPLAQLAEATAHIARGEPLPALPSGGPREVRELARALNAAAAEASRLARDRELLLAGVSHDLRTPLARLRMAIELLPAESAGSDLRAGMATDVEEMDAIIGQFLALVREGQEEPTVAVELDALAREVTEARRREGHQIALQPGAPAPVRGRRTVLQRALGNLVDNALVHARPPVTVLTGRDQHRAWLAVQDHGPGIDPHRLPRLLRTFAADGGEGRQPGHGLGLAVVERAARLHGGQVLARREGDTFEIRLEWPDSRPDGSDQ